MMLTLANNSFIQRTYYVGSSPQNLLAKQLGVQLEGFFLDIPGTCQALAKDMNCTVDQDDYLYKSLYAPIFSSKTYFKCDEYYFCKILGCLPGVVYESNDANKINFPYQCFLLQARVINITCDESINQTLVGGMKVISTTLNQTQPGQSQFISSSDDVVVQIQQTYNFRILDENLVPLYVQENVILFITLTFIPETTQQVLLENQARASMQIYNQKIAQEQAQFAQQQETQNFQQEQLGTLKHILLALLDPAKQRAEYMQQVREGKLLQIQNMQTSYLQQRQMLDVQMFKYHMQPQEYGKGEKEKLVVLQIQLEALKKQIIATTQELGLKKDEIQDLKTQLKTKETIIDKDVKAKLNADDEEYQLINPEEVSQLDVNVQKLNSFGMNEDDDNIARKQQARKDKQLQEELEDVQKENEALKKQSKKQLKKQAEMYQQYAEIEEQNKAKQDMLESLIVKPTQKVQQDVKDIIKEAVKPDNKGQVSEEMLKLMKTAIDEGPQSRNFNVIMKGFQMADMKGGSNVIDKFNPVVKAADSYLKNYGNWAPGDDDIPEDAKPNVIEVVKKVYEKFEKK